jgi:hypothetical protein
MKGVLGDEVQQYKLFFPLEWQHIQHSCTCQLMLAKGVF